MNLLSVFSSLFLFPSPGIFHTFYTHFHTQFSSKDIQSIPSACWKRIHQTALVCHQPLSRRIPILALIRHHRSKCPVSFWWIPALNTWAFFLPFDLSLRLSSSSGLLIFNIKRRTAQFLSRRPKDPKDPCLRCKLLSSDQQLFSCNFKDLWGNPCVKNDDINSLNHLPHFPRQNWRHFLVPCFSINLISLQVPEKEFW